MPRHPAERPLERGRITVERLGADARRMSAGIDWRELEVDFWLSSIEYAQDNSMPEFLRVMRYRLTEFVDRCLKQDETHR